MFQERERERSRKTQTVGSLTGCALLIQWLPGGAGPRWSVGKETKITASEQEVGKLLETSVKYERCHFTEQN